VELEKMPKFWEIKSLSEMTDAEWESLCDGCGQCCLHKLEDDDTGDIYITRIACQLLDLTTCQCTNYKQRTTLVADCLAMREMPVEQYSWMPKTCAYRLLHEGKPLPTWHPLRTSQKHSVKKAGMSVSHYAISEAMLNSLNELEDHILELHR
jgi:uncharacterized cysteine cluster protein YcgN (CxxCxxCC family)